MGPVSHRHYCPDETTCAQRGPCCLYTEGDCLCDWENQCRGATPPVCVVELGVGIVLKKRPQMPTEAAKPRSQPRRKRPRAKRRNGHKR